VIPYLHEISFSPLAGAVSSIDKGVLLDTVIGRGTKFENRVQVGNDAQIGSNCLGGYYTATAGTTCTVDDVIFRAKITICEGLVIG
jgi:UDP-3-O-[3-hydroxymyristoyl] glucosamine N-acyltransferase